MAELEIVKHDQETRYLIEVDYTSGGRKLYMDITDEAVASNEKDAKSGYPEPGPALCQTIEDAIAYAKYVEGCNISFDNISEFETPIYKFVVM